MRTAVCPNVTNETAEEDPVEDCCSWCEQALARSDVHRCAECRMPVCGGCARQGFVRDCCSACIHGYEVMQNKQRQRGKVPGRMPNTMGKCPEEEEAATFGASGPRDCDAELPSRTRLASASSPEIATYVQEPPETPEDPASVRWMGRWLVPGGQLDPPRVCQRCEEPDALAQFQCTRCHRWVCSQCITAISCCVKIAIFHRTQYVPAEATDAIEEGPLKSLFDNIAAKTGGFRRLPRRGNWLSAKSGDSQPSLRAPGHAF